MPLGRFNLHNRQNVPIEWGEANPGPRFPSPIPRGMQRLLSSQGQNPFPMRGIERFMQKRGMNFPGMPQGGTLQDSNPQGSFGNLSNTLNVQAPPQKSGGIKAFLSQFGRKPK